ncbi:MAG: immunoglobulin domain-containing protein, partial [Oscillospiraceae bacterium]|nr:immunoglobulin domain-containing protein [Oscillospiraceae bacterium]
RSDVSYKELTNATYVYDMATLAEENGKTNDYTKTTCGQKIYDYCFGNEELSDVKSYKVLNTINEGHSDHNGICFEVVLGKPAKINMSPTPASVKQGATATFAVNAENVKKFQWQYYSSANGVWKNVGVSIPSAKTAVLKFTGEAKYNGWYYRCAVTGWDGDIEYSNPAKLTVLLSAKINAQPKAASVKQNAKATFTVKADNAENYQWQYSKNGTTWRNTGDSIPNTATLSFTALAKYNGYYYRCAVTGQDGAVKYSGKAKLTVKK